ncbi:MAG: hypothetical protein DMF62_02565 [Acidobacteria bacterium]|nr:MAG: hypothetical protein DMF62_02565 [Acidobacteriota bacterium]
MSLDEYPTDLELEHIAKWPAVTVDNGPADWHDFMAEVRALWWAADWGWKRKGNAYWISTGGWSGNESLINAMQENFLFWSMCWDSSRRGGHYKFVINNVRKAGRKPKENQ